MDSATELSGYHGKVGRLNRIEGFRFLSSASKFKALACVFRLLVIAVIYLSFWLTHGSHWPNQKESS